MEKIIFFGGKGGVGKTSCSSAFAVYNSKKGRKTLLVSTDPAHSISDIFERPIGRQIVKLMENLDGVEIDAEFESKQYIKRIRANLKNIISPIIIEEINKQLDVASVSPGTHEAALFDKMIEIINKKSKEYDHIIFDTAPAGHTIRLLTLPELLGMWIDVILSKRRKALTLFYMLKSKNDFDKERDPVVKILLRRKENIDKARKLLIDKRNMSFIFVMNAEKLSIEETKKAINLLEKYKIPIKELIVNKILPEKASDEFWKRKKELENRYLDEIENIFRDKKIIKMPLFQTDMRSNSINYMANIYDAI